MIDSNKPPTPQMRNYAINWIKGLMMLFIVLLHTSLVPLLHHGYLAVDMFFFFSGFYLMQSYYIKPTTAVSYTWSRIKRFYLPYLLCFLFSCALRYEGLTSFPDFDSFLEKYAQFAFSFTLTEEIGPKVMTEHILDGSWFLSVLVIAGFLVYSMLEYNKRLSVHILFPSICIVGFTFIFTLNPVIMNWSRVGAISIPLLRGFTEMVAGALIFEVFTQYKDAVQRRSTLINIAAILSFVLFIALMFATKPLDVYLLVTAPCILLGAVIENSWFNNALSHIRGGVFSFIGRYTIFILFAHPPAILLIHWSNEHVLHQRFENLELVILDLVLTSIATAILYYSCRFIHTKWTL